MAVCSTVTAWATVTAVVWGLGVLPARAEDAQGLRSRLLKAQQAHPELPDGSFTSVAYSLDVADRIAGGPYATQAGAHRKRASQWLSALEAGRDPFAEAKGQLVMRGYRSQLSESLQGYAIYLPPNYDPNRKYPVLIAMHGGSANGNLFLGVVLGNNMNWKTYREHLWDIYEPRWKPDWIVVAPDGFGQIMWRWMGEKDVLDVLDDVQRHYAVDADRIVLSGLSNGGVGAYNIGMRHAYRFAAVVAIAGAPSWVQYAGGNPDPLQLSGLLPLSGMSLAENAQNTDFRYFHGRTDTGPMKPRFVEAFGKHIRTLGVPFKERWYDAGHDLLYLVHRHGRIYGDLDPLRRQTKPKEVVLVTGDYRAARQHWIEVTRLHAPPALARVHGQVEGSKLSLEVDSGCDALALHVGDLPLPDTEVEIVVNDKRVYRGPKAALGDRYHLVRDDAGFAPGFPADGDHLVKRAGLSGPLPDAYYGATLHVYGTGRAEDTQALKRAAERGARGWPLWLWGYRQKVVADTAVTTDMMRDHHLVLYATPGSHRLLTQMERALPIRVTGAGVHLGDQRISTAGVGTRFIYPNPLSPERYVVVQAAPRAADVMAGHNLPDFLPDYVVYDRQSTRKRPRLLFHRRKAPPALGYFDGQWRLPSIQDAPTGNDPAPTPSPADLNQAAPPDPTPTPVPAPAPDATPVDQNTTTATKASAPVTPPPPGVLPRNARRAPGAAPGADGGAMATTRSPVHEAAASAPPPPRRFATAAGSQAGKAARAIARRVHGGKNYRALAPFATWVRDRRAVWSVPSRSTCMKRLRALGVRALPYEGTALRTPVPTPVEVSGQVNGVWFRSTHEERVLLMSCALATRLPVLARVAKRHGVRGIDIMSSYRKYPKESFHTLGMGLDVLRFWTTRGVLSVVDHFRETPDVETCRAPRPRTWQARALLDIACRLHRSRAFSTVLTPNYNEGHRDHFHLDVRPDDPRLYLR